MQTLNEQGEPDVEQLGEEKKATPGLSKEEAAQRIAASAIELQNSSKGGIQGDRINCLVSKMKQPSVVIPVSMGHHENDDEIARRKKWPEARRDIFDIPDDSPRKGIPAARPRVLRSNSSSQVAESSPDIKKEAEEGINDTDETIHVASSAPRKRGRPRKIEEQSRRRRVAKKPLSEASLDQYRSRNAVEVHSNILKQSVNAITKDSSKSIRETPEGFGDPNVTDRPGDLASIVELKRSSDRSIQETLEKINEENENSEELNGGDINDDSEASASRYEQEESPDMSVQDGREGLAENGDEREFEEPNSEEPNVEEPNAGELNSEECDEEESSIDESNDGEAVPLSFQMFGRDEDWRGVIKAARKIRRQAKYYEPASTVVHSLIQCIRGVHRHYDQYTGELDDLVAYGEPPLERMRTLIDSIGQMDRSNQDTKKAIQTRIRDLYLHGIPRLVLLLERFMTICDELDPTHNDVITIREIMKLQRLTIELCEKPKFCERAANIKFIRPTGDITYVRAVRNLILPPLRDIHKTFSQELRRRQDALREAKLERKREHQRERWRRNAQIEREEKDRKKLERKQKIYEDLMKNRQYLGWR